jgi:hypothetical protein
MTTSHVEKFKVIYDGPALADHTMDVRDLAPALLSISNLIDESGRLIYGPEFEVNVHVQNVGDGCFMTELSVLYKEAVNLFSGDAASAGLNLLEYLGLAGGATVGLLTAIKKYRGKLPTKVEEDEETGMATVEFDGELVEVPNEVMRLYRDLPVRKAVESVVEPLQKDGIESISFGESLSSYSVKIEKAERESFKSPEVQSIELLRDRREAYCSIVSLAFQEGNKWRLHDGNNTFHAAIIDEDFLNLVQKDQIRFAKSDFLKCDLEIVQSSTQTGLNTEYIVHKVLEHKPAPRQLNLSTDD